MDETPPGRFAAVRKHWWMAIAATGAFVVAGLFLPDLIRTEPALPPRGASPVDQPSAVAEREPADGMSSFFAGPPGENAFPDDLEFDCMISPSTSLRTCVP